eukprot:CAMPEP_0117002926 /NCGR_PEP_ID=MMETSP0472-20121206/4421_1 /TAXON_ID=693140 ORGANISM="Tiarina fusus, Strain LIS" /NCGR_SAMPLE_ID=MMETSP0472 /ASSEMBLY_ACC=CAM_ASM_000603 /LENGTH=118 /DNA_ID=CAMNT_0004703413 /DNA_START=274 /DNA_END=630 /DNA_ORIENTATION=+
MGKGFKKLFELIWKRNPDDRIVPKNAIGICGILLWGCPSSQNMDGWTQDQLKNEFELFERDVNHVTETDCEQWQNVQRKEVTELCKEDCVPIDVLLRMKFLLEFSPKELQDCMVLLAN